MTTTIIKRTMKGTYHLYVNGHIAVSHESLAVCSAVQIALQNLLIGRFYSEGAEVADRIRTVLSRSGGAS